MNNRTSDRITVGLSNASKSDMDYLIGTSGLSKTDIVNHAIQLFALFEKARLADGRMYIQNADGSRELVHCIM